MKRKKVFMLIVFLLQAKHIAIYYQKTIYRTTETARLSSHWASNWLISLLNTG